MAVAFDVATSSGIQNTSSSFSHNPVGVPRGVLVLIYSATNTDHITAVTYAGTSLSEVALSPVLAGAESGSYGYFLGSSVPTNDPATVAVTSSSGSDYVAVCITVTAAADTEVHDTSSSTTTVDDPSVALTITKDSFCAGVLGSGQTNVPTAGASTTLITNTDFGVNSGGASRKTTNTSTDFTYGFVTPGSDDVALLAVAIAESAAPLAKIIFNNYLFAECVSTGIISLSERIR